jgi:hypothetical protein
MNAVNDLVLLTRRGCGNTADMRDHLDAALSSLHRPPVYRVIDLDALPPTDPRRGYGTPTIVCGGKDLFGLPEPAAPCPVPT